MSSKKCAILFSGGTDSTCVAALKAQEFSEIHLLTFYDQSTKNDPMPTDNVARLRQHFPDVRFIHISISTDNIIKYLSFKNYFYSIFKYGFYNTATPAFSSLSWHLRTLVYCLEHEIYFAFDGITNEMTQLPGHMSSVLDEFKKLYADYGIDYSNPVRDWSVPDDQEFLDRIIVDQHGFIFPSEKSQKLKTTGQYLFEREIFPHPNVKGSTIDRHMQHDCYPFVLYNILFFWLLLNFSTYHEISIKMAKFIHYKIEVTKPMIEKLTNTPGGRDLWQKEVLIE